MNSQNYTSQWLSKKLAESGCELKSDYAYVNDKGKILNTSHWFYKEEHPYAYDILNDICVKYPKEFFGEENSIDISIMPQIRKENYRNKPAYILRTRHILKLLQQNKKDEAEKYIWENCKFNPKNQII